MGNENASTTDELNTSIHAVGEAVWELEGKGIDRNALMKLDDLVTDCHAKMHRDGFYTGFEVACNILRMMLGTKN